MGSATLQLDVYLLIIVDCHVAFANLAASTPDQLAAIAKNRLKRIQYRPQLIDGFLDQTGLTLEPEPP